MQKPGLRPKWKRQRSTGVQGARHTPGGCDGPEGPAPRPADAAVNAAVAL